MPSTVQDDEAPIETAENKGGNEEPNSRGKQSSSVPTSPYPSKPSVLPDTSEAIARHLPASTMASESRDGLTLRAKWARFLVREQLARELNIAMGPGQAPWDRSNLPPRSQVLPGDIAPQQRKLCIVGAGITGLYIALILDTLEIKNVSVDFFEASDRIGGRCFTYEFSKRPHEYYDVGAMRFPEIDVMAR
jgi:hypothetical protein